MSSAYVSKEERKIQIDDPSGKWSDVTLLPEWGEEFYDVYTARKHGKWVMLKALKPQYAFQERFREMISREFETRYSLAHPNIVMVNDFEEVPGIGMAIITDDVYGYSLRRLIDEKRLTPRIIHRLETQLPDAMAYIQENHVIHHPITPDSIIFTEYTENLKLINVGYDQRESLTPLDTMEDLFAYGTIINEVLDHTPTRIPRLRRIAQRCTATDPIRRFRSFDDLRLSMQRGSSTLLVVVVISVIVLLGVLVCWLVANSI